MVAINQIPVNQPNTTTSEDYSQTVVINALLAILNDSTLNSHHHTVIEAVMSIFKTQGLKCVSFLPQVCRNTVEMPISDVDQILPAFTMVTRTAASRLQDFHLQQLAILVGIIKQHIRNYVPDIFALVRDLWDNTPLQLPLVALIEALGKALNAEFKPFLPTIIPLMLKVFEGELNDKRMATQSKIFEALLTFGSNIEEYLHLLIPVIVKSYERPDASSTLRKKAIQSIDGLSKRVNFSDHASRIVLPLVRVLENSANDVRTTVMETFCSLVIQLGSDFAIFVPTINKVCSHQCYMYLDSLR